MSIDEPARGRDQPIERRCWMLLCTTWRSGRATRVGADPRASGTGSSMSARSYSPARPLSRRVHTRAPTCGRPTRAGGRVRPPPLTSPCTPTSTSHVARRSLTPVRPRAVHLYIESLRTEVRGARLFCGVGSADRMGGATAAAIRASRGRSSAGWAAEYRRRR